jgi:aspartate/methionine/tyrosine aminotransferase
MLKKYKQKVDIFIDECKKHNININQPETYFFLFLPTQKFSSKNTYNYAKELLLTEKILIWPGEDFGNKDYFRINLASINNEQIPNLVKKMII